MILDCFVILKLRFVCTYYKHNLIFTLFVLCTLVSQITDAVRLFFTKKFFQPLCFILDCCLWLKSPCTFIILPFLPCTLIRDIQLLGTLEYIKVCGNLQAIYEKRQYILWFQNIKCFEKTHVYFSFILKIVFFHYIWLYVKKKYKKWDLFSFWWLFDVVIWFHFPKEYWNWHTFSV